MHLNSPIGHRVRIEPAVETQAEFAELAKLTPARVTQIMNLLSLAPEIQEEIFFLPPVTDERQAVTERDRQQVLNGGVERTVGTVGCVTASALEARVSRRYHRWTAAASLCCMT
jgi:hypothetical protein